MISAEQVNIMGWLIDEEEGSRRRVRVCKRRVWKKIQKQRSM